MHLTNLDFLFWAVAFVENLGLFFVLWYRRRARSFPFFTALTALSILRTIVLYFLLRYGSKESYFYTYWSLATLDTILELCVAYEIAGRVFRPVGVWARDVRSSFLWLLGLSVTAAGVLSWLASPPARLWVQGIVTKGNLFAATLVSELFVAMMGLSVSAGLPWKTHVAKIAQGLGTCSLVTMLIEIGHSYFGVGREIPAFVFLSHVRIAAYLGCVIYWIVTLWREEQPGRQMTEEIREELVTLQRRIEYDLQDLRSRTKW
jgi:hypothetical protein